MPFGDAEATLVVSGGASISISVSLRRHFRQATLPRSRLTCLRGHGPRPLSTWILVRPRHYSGQPGLMERSTPPTVDRPSSVWIGSGGSVQNDIPVGKDHIVGPAAREIDRIPCRDGLPAIKADSSPSGTRPSLKGDSQADRRFGSHGPPLGRWAGRGVRIEGELGTQNMRWCRIMWQVEPRQSRSRFVLPHASTSRRGTTKADTLLQRCPVCTPISTDGSVSGRVVLPGSKLRRDSRLTLVGIRRPDRRARRAHRNPGSGGPAGDRKSSPSSGLRGHRQQERQSRMMLWIPVSSVSDSMLGP